MNKFPAFKRAAGVLMPLSAMPSPFGIGCFSRDVEVFADMAADMGFSWWQVLPITLIGAGNSPYSGLSTYAGNYMFVNPFLLAEEGLLTQEEAEAAKYGGQPYRVDYDFARDNAKRYLHTAFGRLNDGLRRKMAEFAEENAGWLEDYAMFMSLAESRGTEWWNWEKDYADRTPPGLANGAVESVDSL